MAKKNKYLSSLTVKLVVSLVLLISITTAWFILAKKADISALSLDVTKASSVAVSKNGDEWSNQLEITHESDGAVRITEFTGNGKKLFGPVIVSNTVESFYEVDYEHSKNNGYIDFQLQFKSDGNADIYLAGGSALLPEGFDTNLNDNKVSKNYIVGAVRVAMWCADDENAEPLVWAPNSTYQYNTTTKKVSTSGTVESEYQYAEGTAIESIKSMSTGNKTNGASDDGLFVWGDIAQIETTDMQPVIKLSPADGEESIKTLNVRVWVEGTDREAVKDFIGGRFKIQLNFTANFEEGEEN